MSPAIRAFIFAAIFSGCSSAERLSAREAHQTFDAVTQVTSEVVSLSRDAVERGAQGLSVDTSGGRGSDFTVDGGLDRGATWEGGVDISGTVENDGNDYGYELLVDFDNVVTDEGTIVDGDLSVMFFAEDVGDWDLSWAVGIALDGDVAVTGAAEGDAQIQYDLELRLDGFDVELTAEGDISGHDVSGWSDGITIVL